MKFAAESCTHAHTQLCFKHAPDVYPLWQLGKDHKRYTMNKKISLTPRNYRQVGSKGVSVLFGQYPPSETSMQSAGREERGRRKRRSWRRGKKKQKLKEFSKLDLTLVVPSCAETRDALFHSPISHHAARCLPSRYEQVPTRVTLPSSRSPWLFTYREGVIILKIKGLDGGYGMVWVWGMERHRKGLRLRRHVI